VLLGTTSIVAIALGYELLFSAGPIKPKIVFSTASVSHDEGNSGSTTYEYALTRTGDLSGASSVDWAVIITGTAPVDAADFVGGALPSGTVNFPIGEASGTISFQVNGDTTVEFNETFLVKLSNATNARLGISIVPGSIFNDDADPGEGDPDLAPAVSATGLLVWNGSTGVISAIDLADPPEFIDIIPEDAAEGDFLWREIDSNTPPDPDSPDYRSEKRVLLWDGTKYIFGDPGTNVPHNFTIQTGLSSTKHWYARSWIERDYGDMVSTPINKSPVADFTVVSLGIRSAWSETDHSNWSAANQTVLTTVHANDTFSVTKDAYGGSSMIRGTTLLTSGKYYFRVLRSGDAPVLAVGVASEALGTSGSLTGGLFSPTPAAQSCYCSNHNIYIGGTYVGDVPTNHSDYVDVYLDMDERKIWFANEGDPVAGTGGHALSFTGGAHVFGMVGISGSGATVTSNLIIDTLENNAARAPEGFTAIGA
jgi:hypothetical protein